MSEIQALVNRVQSLNESVDFWNKWMVWGLLFAAIAAVWVVFATSVTIRKTKELGAAQDQLTAAKERQLSVELKDKDIKIASLNKDSETLKGENLILQSNLLSLQKQSEPRRLTGEQKERLSKLLKPTTNSGAFIVTPLMDGEASDYADDFEASLHAANWQTERIKNLISSKFGVSVVTAGTPIPLAKTLSDALTAAGISHDNETVDNGNASMSPAFQTGYLYLVIQHKTLPAKKH